MYAGGGTMLHAECCEKGVHPWVPRRSSAPGPMGPGSAEHANEVIMLTPLPPSVQCGALAVTGSQGTLVNAAKYRCHIWHNERSAPASVNEPAKKKKKKNWGRRSIFHLAPAEDLHKVCMKKKKK